MSITAHALMHILAGDEFGSLASIKVEDGSVVITACSNFVVTLTFDRAHRNALRAALIELDKQDAHPMTRAEEGAEAARRG